MSRYRTKVSRAPARRGGAKLKMNLDAGPEKAAWFDFWAFCRMAATAIVRARRASTSQTKSHFGLVGCLEAKIEATTAVKPTTMSPLPGTPVKEEARSIVDRIKWRSSSASFGFRCNGSSVILITQ